MLPTCVLPLFGCLCLLLGLPFRKLPLSFFALEKCLYLREQDTGQGFYFMEGYPSAVVIGFLFAWHGITPSKLLLAEQITLEHSTVSGDETAPCILGNLVGGVGVIQNDLREDIIRPAAHPEIQVGLDLAGENVGVRALGGEDQVDAKGPSQAG